MTTNDPKINSLPDCLDQTAVQAVLGDCQGLLAKLTTEQARDLKIAFIDGQELASSIAGSWRNVALENEAMRRFIGGLFCGDLLAFPSAKPVEAGVVAPDQVDLKRLIDTVISYPWGARLWLAERPGQNNQWMPVGYTFHYPLPDETFTALSKGTISYRHSIRPHPFAKPIATENSMVRDEHGNPTSAYIFCYGAHSAFHHTPLTKQMLSMLAEDLKAADYKGLSAVTVSGPGSQVAEKFGMHPVGEITLQGETEILYATK